MKLPSLSHVVEQASRAARRFPFAIASALVGTLATIVLTHDEGNHRFFWVINIAVVTGLGISFLMLCVLLAESKRWGTMRGLLAQLAGAMLLAAYYYSLPTDVFSSPEMHMIRFALFVTGMHLLVAVIAFSGKNNVNGFWQFNKSLFLRFLTGGLYSAVLFGGLALALAALDHLFGLDVGERWYADLWFTIVGVFNTWFFLAGVPADFDALDNVTEYPEGLKFFTQFILLTIVAVYLLILYAYMGKILLTWNWPHGWVSGLVLGFSITGIVSLLLIYPIKDLVENVWMRIVVRWFYVVLIPLAIMMLLAVWRRVLEYGVTESRYIGIVVALWLIGISIYFILSAVKNIKLIPGTLCIIAFLISFGPWGVFQVSLRSQMERLRDVLTRTNILVGRIAKKTDRSPSYEDAQTISAIVRYICTVHSEDPLQPMFVTSLDTLGGKDTTHREFYRRSQKASRIVALMGVQYVNEWQQRDRTYRFYRSDESTVIDLHGYFYSIHFKVTRTSELPKPVETGDGKYTLQTSDSSITVRLESSGVRDSVVLNVNPLSERLFQENTVADVYPIPVEKMAIAESSASVRAKVYFHTLECRREDRTPLKSGFVADVYFGRK